MSFVLPHVHLIGYTTIDKIGLNSYLKESGNEEFLLDISQGISDGLSDGEILCSFYAKLCYASLTIGHNKNISRTRGIWENLINCYNQGHGSVFEHATINFVIRDCSRVFSHELVRHRVGTAFSQTSGRYVRGDKLDLILDPILEPVKSNIEELCNYIQSKYSAMVSALGLDNMSDMTLKKQLTSALRRILPNGQSNEMGFSCNFRAIRHLIQLRTSRQAEWEIRYIFEQIYDLLQAKFPLLFYGAKVEVVKGIKEITGMKIQPWEAASDV